jgi:hypothetical protein
MLLSPQEKLIVSSLKGDLATWPQSEPSGFADSFIEVSATQSTHPLIFHQLNSNPCLDSWPANVRDSLKQEAQRFAAIDMIRMHELTTVLEKLANNGVRPLIFKGTALAYSHYRTPSLRTRNDTDLLIDDTDKGKVDALLEKSGYRQPNAISGDLVSYESCYRKTDKFGVSHVLDVHTRVNNSQIFARSLTYTELSDDARSVPALGPAARALSPVHALLLACLHRAAHMRYIAYFNGDEPYYEGNLLIWLYDVHLLAINMNQDEWDRFMALAAEKKLRAICLDALRITMQCFHTDVPARVVTSLSVDVKSEASAVYLTGNATRVFVNEVRAIPGIHRKLLFLWENVFPPAEYIRQKYDEHHDIWLPVLYLRRIILGLIKRS